MSSVHDQIVIQAFNALPEDAKLFYSPHLDDLKSSSWYPDIFANTAMPAEEKIKIDSQADRFILPPPPKSAIYRKIIKLTKDEVCFGASPLREMFKIEYCLRGAFKCLKSGEIQELVKFCGVFSHVVADIGEPIHAINPQVIDEVLPPPAEYLGLELHANVEMLKAPVDISGYRPKSLGGNISQVIMNCYSGLVKVKRVGAALTVPIVQALYSKKRQRAVSLSQVAQNESARFTADFMFTLFQLQNGEEINVLKDGPSLDLREYPYVHAEMCMLYRYRPMIDVSLIPYSGGDFHPLSVLGREGAIDKVRGIGMLPSLAPPYSKEHLREARATYYLVPGTYSKLQSRIGINPLFRESFGKAQFLVIGDGKELFSSAPIGPEDEAIEIVVPLNRTRWMTLAMRYLTCPTHQEIKRLHCRWAMHGVWAEPKLTG